MARRWIGSALGLAAVAGALVFAFTGGLAGAGDDEPGAGAGGMPQAQKKIDHPLAKAIVGTWEIATKSEFGDANGTVKFALGVGDTAILQDYESTGAMGPYAGHGIWKFSDDGKSLHLWWIDVRSAGPHDYAGTLTDTGYDLKTADDGTRITLAKTEAGFEFKLYGPDGKLFFTDTYTKK